MEVGSIETASKGGGKRRIRMTGKEHQNGRKDASACEVTAQQKGPKHRIQ